MAPDNLPPGCVVNGTNTRRGGSDRRQGPVRSCHGGFRKVGESRQRDDPPLPDGHEGPLQARKCFAGALSPGNHAKGLCNAISIARRACGDTLGTDHRDGAWGDGRPYRSGRHYAARRRRPVAHRNPRPCADGHRARHGTRRTAEPRRFPEPPARRCQSQRDPGESVSGRPELSRLHCFAAPGNAAGAVIVYGWRAAEPTLRRRRELGSGPAIRDLGAFGDAGFRSCVWAQHAWWGDIHADQGRPARPGYVDAAERRQLWTQSRAVGIRRLQLQRAELVRRSQSIFRRWMAAGVAIRRPAVLREARVGTGEYGCRHELGLRQQFADWKWPAGAALPGSGL